MTRAERAVFVTLAYLAVITALYYLFRYGPLAIEWVARLSTRIFS